MKTSFRIYLKVTLFVLLAVAVVLGAVGAWLYHDHKSKSWATVHYLTPDGENIERVRLGEEHTLLVPEEIEGYTFLRWRDEDVARTNSAWNASWCLRSVPPVSQ